jgi:hypothetical protein
VDIWITTGVSGTDPTYEFLGNSVNGIQVTDQAYTVPVFSDVNGGEHGPPVDYQFLGKQDLIEFEMVQYNDAVLEKISARYRLANGTGAVTFKEGMLLGCAGAAFDIVLLAANWVRHYPGAIPLQPIRRNFGTLHTRAHCSFLCNAIDNILYDSVTTKYSGIPT